MKRRAFTLVELLVVVVIIGVLVGLISAAAVPAIRKARETRILTEISQLEIALNEHKGTAGEYPPDFGGLDAEDLGIQQQEHDRILRHLVRVFPRYRPGQSSGSTKATPWERFRDDVDLSWNGILDGRPDVNLIRPDTAVAFWLGGMPGRDDDPHIVMGFSANPANPFAMNGSRLPSLFEFDERRLKRVEQTGWIRYITDHVQNPSGGDVPPYVYFRAFQGGYARNIGVTGLAPGQVYVLGSISSFLPRVAIEGCGIAVPYAGSFNEPRTGEYRVVWPNGNGFQIVHPGLDGEYSLEGDWNNDGVVDGNDSASSVMLHATDPTDGNLTAPEDDNLTNVSEGRLDASPRFYAR